MNDRARTLVMTSMVLIILSVAAGRATGTGGANEPAAGEWDFQPRLLWEVRTLAGDTLRVPAELRLLSDGGIVFRDFGRDVSYLLDREGRLVATLAAAGDGPGEVPRYLNCFPADGEIAIASPAALHFFTNEGGYLRTRDNNAFARFPLAFVGLDRFLCAPGLLTSGAEGRAEIQEVDLATGEARVFASVSAEDAPAASGGPSLMIRGLIPSMELARDPRTGAVYFGRSDVYRIHVATAAGRAVRSFGLVRDRIVIDEEDKRRHLADVSLPEEQLTEIVRGLPSELTHFRRLQVIGDLLYVTVTGTIDRDPREVRQDVFTLAGDYLYRARLALPGPASIAGSEDNLILGEGFCVAVLAHPDGSRSVACYEVRIPAAD